MKSRAWMVATLASACFLTPTCLLSAAFASNSPSATEGDKSSGAIASADSDKAVAIESPQSSDAPHSARGGKHVTPRIELFLGYSYLRAVPTLSPGNRMEWLNGGSASAAFNFNRYLGLVGDFGGFNATELELTGSGASPAGVSDAGGNTFTYMGGPRLSFRNHSRVTPFAQALFGDIHASEVKLSGCTGAPCTPLPSENAFAMTAGGGIDIRVHRHLAIRPIQAEYLMTRFADLTTGERQRQNDIRLSAGIVLRFGGSPPPPPPLPVSYSCVASPSSAYPGDPITVTGTALNLDPNDSSTYTWTSDGGKISGTSNTANIDTSGTAPGNYAAKGQVRDGGNPGRLADCSAAYALMAFQPPTVTCSPNPGTVRPGDSSTITAQGMSPQNRPLTYSFSATEGSINSTFPTATLNTVAASVGTITVTCTVSDDKGQTGSSTTTVSVVAPAAPPIPATQKLCSIKFERDTKRPTRVDNEAKACLDDVALSLQHSPDAKVAVIGNSVPSEKSSHRRFLNHAADQRAVNTKDYLVKEKGADASRVAAYSGSSDGQTVDIVLIPSGAALDTNGMTPAPESVKPVTREDTH
jgi:hypothetical protein